MYRKKSSVLGSRGAASTLERPSKVVAILECVSLPAVISLLLVNTDQRYGRVDMGQNGVGKLRRVSFPMGVFSPHLILRLTTKHFRRPPKSSIKAHEIVRKETRCGSF